MMCDLSFSSVVSLNYSPLSILYFDKDETSGIIRTDSYEKDKDDKLRYLYFSRISLSFYREPEPITGFNNRYSHGGIFFDLLHKKMEIEPVNIKYFEDGGSAHALIGILGLSYKIFAPDAFFSEFGFGLSMTALCSNNINRSVFSENISPVFKFGVGYRVSTGGNNFIDLGVDMTTPITSYFKVEGDGYLQFISGGIYPYIGISF